MSLFQEIRDASRAVAERADFVRIDEAALKKYALAIPAAEMAAQKLDPSRHFLDRGADTAAFIVTLDTINFGSGWFPHLKKRPGLSGYFTIASALNDFFRAEGPLTMSRLVHLNGAECARIFGQDAEGPLAYELMQRFATALNDLGRLLIDSYRGSFTALIESAGNSAEQLVRLLSAMPFFDDVAQFRDKRVPFYKRAQLTAADLALAFDGQGWGRFDDLGELTIFADNLVPHVLRMDGVLRYDPDLAARIDREELIRAGSVEEVEIRAGALHAVELMVAELRGAGRPTTAMSIDFLLWNRGQRPQYKLAKPRHRTRTVFY
ncbi:MAG TPA: queuosine salvage family protein [Methylomirabilota bacterium]|nr:queuosine salvage family protein [Methylomirabilota bacterium]